MCKKEHEYFKEYAQRWRNLAAQVASPMVEREMITMITDMLPVFYYEKLVGYMPSSFADLVFAGKRIEVGLKRGKFNYVAPARTCSRRSSATGVKRKKGDAHVVTLAPAWPKPQQTPHDTHQYTQHHPGFSANTRNSSNLEPIQQRTSALPKRALAQTPAPVQPRPTGNSNPGMNFNPGRNPPV